MPAIVRGGRRQGAGNGAGSARSAAPQKAPKSASRGRGKRIPVGKYRVIGSVPMPNELTAWLAVILIVGLLSAILMTGNRAQTLSHAVVDFADARIGGLGLNLQNVRLIGVSDAAAPDIKRALDLSRGQPFALMDLGEVQKAVENVGWVKSATVRRQFPGLLVVSVVERPRLAVWQYQGKDVVIDDQGQIIPEAHAVNFISLPLVVGEGANEQAADVLELLNARPALLQKTYALVRVDTRRWDIHLKNGTVIKLPALNQDQALARLDALIAQRRVLDQGFAEIDMLDPEALQVIPLQSHPAAPQ
ncbi:MAG TPA: cell division protein FtsQ/DivIB [Asticcacaulis sp.]|nr:cell division protein FtsQ/DivIB [Asticcacaulis sp.]